MRNQTPSSTHKIQKQNLTSAVVGTQFTFNRVAGNCSTLKLFLALAVILICFMSANTAGATTTPAGLAVSTSSLDLGNANVGHGNSTWARLINTEKVSMVVSSATISNSEFSLGGITFPLTIPAGQNTAFYVVFKPVAGGVVNATVSFAYSGASAPQVLALRGNGIGTGAALTASPNAIAFGGVQAGASGSQTIALKNTGRASIQISKVSIAGSGFTMSALTLPVTLAGGQSVSLTAKFVPAAAGSATGTITIASNASDPTLTIGLSGTCLQGTAAAIPGSVSFGSVVTGSGNSQTIKLSNTGTGSMTITQASVSGAGLSQVGLSLPMTLAAGGSTSFNVLFAPTAAGAVTGSVTLVSNASDATLAIPVSGTGVQAAPMLSTNPASLNFGNVNDGSSSVLDVTLSNTGNANVSISGVSAMGAGFTTGGISSGLILAPNQSATMQVTFYPANAGVVSGSVTVSSNASNSPGVVALSGTGVQVGAKTVALSWTASATSDVTGYNVYRGTMQGVYAKLNSAPVAAMDFADSTVQSGANTTYYYMVTAVDTNNMESGDSNVATAMIP